MEKVHKRKAKFQSVKRPKNTNVKYLEVKLKFCLLTLNLTLNTETMPQYQEKSFNTYTLGIGGFK